MSLFSFVRKPVGLTTLIAVVIFLGIVGVRVSQNTSVIDDGLGDRPTQVRLLSLSDLNGSDAFVSSVGQVESLGQVELRSQIFEKVKRVNVGIGDFVSAGDLLVELENASVYASLNQARAALDGERARLNEVTKNLQAGQTLDGSYAEVLRTVNDALVESDNAVRSETSGLFGGGKFVYYALFNVCNGGLEQDIDRLRNEADAVLDDWARAIDGLSSSPSRTELDNIIDVSQGHILVASEFMNAVNRGLGDSCALGQSQYDTHRASIPIARDKVTAALTALDDLEQSIASQKIGLNNGDTVASQEARVRSAEATVQGIEANLADTIIRSPISGMVASVPVRLGELVSVGDLLALVVNESGLQVEAFVGVDNAKLIEEGALVKIEDEISGRVARISPSLDPQSKKIEVLISVLDESPDLVVGEFVNVDIAARPGKGSEQFLLPLGSVKAELGGTYVYVVGDNEEVIEVPVEVGQVVGEDIEVSSGLRGVANIIESVRGLNPGDRVETGR